MKGLTKFDKLSLIKLEAKGIELFRGKYTKPNSKEIPFFISADELILSPVEAKLFKDLGAALAELFSVLSQVRGDKPDYFFFRPDVLLTEEGYKVCEVELSPFGFPLAVFLEDAYNAIRKKGGRKIWSQNVLKKFVDFWQKRTKTKKGRFVFSSHTEQFIGQFEFLSKRLKSLGYDFKPVILKSKISNFNAPLYRCFYLYEKSMAEFWEKVKTVKKLPGETSFYETKLPLAIFTNDESVRQKLSKKSRKTLDSMLLPTWVLESDSLPKSFPLGISNWTEIAELSKSKRKFVIKRIGDHPQASWAKSVVFLHKISALATRQLIETALLESGQWIIQPFINSKKVTQNYYSFSDKKWIDMKGRVRLTPYYSFDKGEWLVGKATIRRNTLLIHGATDSINTLITWENR
jgi:hypothetical protein